MEVQLDALQRSQSSNDTVLRTADYSSRYRFRHSHTIWSRTDTTSTCTLTLHHITGQLYIKPTQTSNLALAVDFFSPGSSAKTMTRLFQPLPRPTALVRLKFNLFLLFLLAVLRTVFTPYLAIRRNLTLLGDELQRRRGGQRSWVGSGFGSIGECERSEHTDTTFKAVYGLSMLKLVAADARNSTAFVTALEYCRSDRSSA